MAPHFVRGPTPNPTKWLFFPLQNGNAAQKHYKMAVPSPPWPEQTLGRSCQHFFLTKMIEPFCRDPTLNKKSTHDLFRLTIFDPSCWLGSVSELCKRHGYHGLPQRRRLASGPSLTSTASSGVMLSLSPCSDGSATSLSNPIPADHSFTVICMAFVYVLVATRVLFIATMYGGARRTHQAARWCKHHQSTVMKPQNKGVHIAYSSLSVRGYRAG